jgi:hypothetical protein
MPAKGGCASKLALGEGRSLSLPAGSASGEKSLYDPHCWGISVEKIKVLGAKLHQHWQRFRQRFKCKTRDTSEKALAYLRGQMT